MKVVDSEKAIALLEKAKKLLPGNNGILPHKYHRICKCIEHHTEYKYPSWREFPHTNSNDECCQRKEDD